MRPTQTPHLPEQRAVEGKHKRFHYFTYSQEETYNQNMKMNVQVETQINQSRSVAT